ncbi:MAG TPA: hypothetical protein VFM77_20740 [Terriglobales bacterium]|nr:hypothetical protein [Terriglobales bacterium]
MTPPSILTKLKCELDRDLTDECQVVYLLAEIRKFIESAGGLEDYFALDFHCSLALHTTMTRVGAKRILGRFEKAYPLLVKGQQLPADLQKELSDTIALTKFRDQLKEFLTKNDLIPARMFPGTPDEWVKFIHLYASVIDDCTLQLKGDGLPTVDHVSIHLKMPVGEPGPEWGDQTLFALRWTGHGKDGLSGDHDVYFGYSKN